ncbi:MAG: hypothetical protein QOI78_8752, partial [Actinomycetota bacterium]|nr:hypothetical protein [Actinomycetota bacterium]
AFLRVASWGVRRRTQHLTRLFNRG